MVIDCLGTWDLQLASCNLQLGARLLDSSQHQYLLFRRIRSPAKMKMKNCASEAADK